MAIDASTYRQVELCSGGGGFEAVPRVPLSLDLTAVAQRLAREGVATTDARVMLIVGLEVETTVSRSGRLLFKGRDRAAAGRAFDRLLPLLERAGRARTS